MLCLDPCCGLAPCPALGSPVARLARIGSHPEPVASPKGKACHVTWIRVIRPSVAYEPKTGLESAGHRLIVPHEMSGAPASRWPATTEHHGGMTIGSRATRPDRRPAVANRWPARSNRLLRNGWTIGGPSTAREPNTGGKNRRPPRPTV